jgi:hypothetical protein
MAIFAEVVRLIVGIAWPMAVVAMVFALRREIVASIAVVRERIFSADEAELVAGPVSLRWSGVLAKASNSVFALPVESEVAAIDSRSAVQLSAVTALANPVKSIVDAYDLVRVGLLAMLNSATEQSEYLVSADAAELGIALGHAGRLASELVDAIRVLSDLRESMLSTDRPSVNVEDAQEYVNLAELVLARLPTSSTRFRGNG